MSAIELPTQPIYRITDDDKARVTRIEKAWDAYYGMFEPPLQNMPGQPDDNVMSNRCRPIVDRGVDFLFGKELDICADEDADDTIQPSIDRVWGRKERRIPLLQKLATSGAIAGHAFLRIIPQDDTFRLIVVNPATVYVKTAPQDCDTVQLYCIQWCAHEYSNERPVATYYREEISQYAPTLWVIQHWTRQGDRGAWLSAGDPIFWTYAFPPVFQCQNLPHSNDFWGLPDISSDLIHMNNALNLVQSCINRINKLYGSPLLYSNGASESVLDIQPGRILNLPTADGKITAVPITSDLANALHFADNLRMDIDEQSSVPSVATGRLSKVQSGAVSGIAMKLLFIALQKKTDTKRCLYGELILDVCSALLVLKGITQQVDFTLAWQNALPSDSLPDVQASVLKQRLGISNATLQRELGYDPEEEALLRDATSGQQQQMTSDLMETTIPANQSPQLLA